MQLLLSLIGLFLMGCVLYGLYAGVQTIARGAARLTTGLHTSAPQIVAESHPSCVAETQESLQQASQLSPSPSQRCIGELQSLFGLYQSGALTREEFERFKQHLLSAITAEPLFTPRQETP